MEITRQRKWDKRFIGLAKYISSFSKDPSTKVGAVIFDDDYRVFSIGYNGFAKNVEDSEERLNNRELKYKMVLHAEINAILFAVRTLKNASLATWPFMSCSSCSSAIIQVGIKRCIAPFSDNPRWKADFELSHQMFKEAGVEVELLEPSLFG